MAQNSFASSKIFNASICSANSTFEPSLDYSFPGSKIVVYVIKFYAAASIVCSS